MFKRLIVMLLLVIVGGLFVIPVQAAGTPWKVWLYESQIGRMTEVDSSGSTLRQLQLPIDPDSQYSQWIAVSPDGGLVAYAIVNNNANSVRIHDLVTNANVYTFDAPPTVTTSFDFGVSSLNFSENNDTFAFGYGGFDVPWKVVVIDIHNLSVSSLKQEDPIAASLNDTGVSFIPVVASNRNKAIKFLMIPFGTDGMPTYKAFTWIQESNSIAPNDEYVTPDTATFTPTNEILSAISDDAFPGSRMPDIGFSVNNTLQVFDPKVGQRFIVTALPYIYDPQFIQGGERVAVTHDYPQADGGATYTLDVLERSGAISGTVSDAPSIGINGLLGTQDGFIFAATSGGIDPKSNGTDLYYVETRQASGTFNAVVVWSSALGANARLIWVSNSEASSASTFTAWGHVATPAGDGDGVDITSGVPVGDSAYAVGVNAEVQTTDNDVLNLRSGPGITFAKVGTIPDGTLVTLIEGPHDADGFIWWRVRLPNGVEGWVVSQADGINTLIPR